MGLGGTLWPRPYRPCGATSPNAWEVKGNEVAPEAQSNCAAKPQTFFHVEPLRPCGASSPLKRGAWESAGASSPNAWEVKGNKVAPEARDYAVFNLIPHCYLSGAGGGDGVFFELLGTEVRGRGEVSAGEEQVSGVRAHPVGPGAGADIQLGFPEGTVQELSQGDLGAVSYHGDLGSRYFRRDIPAIRGEPEDGGADDTGGVPDAAEFHRLRHDDTAERADDRGAHILGGVFGDV